MTVEPRGVLADGCAPTASPRVSESMVGGNKDVQEESVSEDDVIAPESAPLYQGGVAVRVISMTMYVKC